MWGRDVLWWNVLRWGARGRVEASDAVLFGDEARGMGVLDLFDLTGRVALVTGGGRGIGKAISEAYGEAGAAVVICGRRVEWLTPTVEELTGRGMRCHAVVADVTRAEDVARVVGEALEVFGQVDILVNNAGQTWAAPMEEMPVERWRQVMEVNTTGMFLMTQAVGRHMLARGAGRVINIASVAGLSGGDAEVMRTIGYNASKGAVVAFTRTLAMEWGRRGVLVNALAPGWFPTRMAAVSIERNRGYIEARTALGRVGALDELKGAAVYLASAASSYVTGQTLVVDGGITL